MPSVIRGGDGFDSDIHQGIGVNQTWQDVTASRAFNAIFTNTTGKPIFIAVEGANYGVNVFVDNLKVAHNSANGAGPNSLGVSVIVPNGSTYKATPSYNDSLVLWTELR